VDGSCRIPVGAWAQKRGENEIHIQGFLAQTTPPPFKASPSLIRTISGPFEDAETLGKSLGHLLKKDLFN